MAINKVINSTTLSLEVQSGTDAAGAPVFRKKNFSGIKLTAAPENVLDVAQAIKGILNNPTRDLFLNETSKLSNN
ncbi:MULTISPECIES: DUF1659 domain-containing protein [Clostridium]|uniref:DUF1659 domain-containing protein n=1 Tax=Clostridium paridis TaxID=2803863 RepID=A0A937FCP4_9CLOT|nr:MULTISPECIES: DUF1659 domain-containing protein [Clostridium]MBL4930370.1 DUF1659 domain-containing protein [Clostridium paridis]